MTAYLKQMFTLAKAARANAHAPYSRFKVGCAVRSKNGKIFAGCNVENAAYPEGCCAETSAFAAMVSAGQTDLTDVVIVADDKMCTPCGGCRQRIREFANVKTRIHIADLKKINHVFTIDELLPYSFGPENLGQKSAAKSQPKTRAAAGSHRSK